VLTLAGTAYAYHKLPPTYQATSSVVFLAPKNMTKAFGENPYLAFTSNINLTADVVRYETMDMRTAQLLAAEGYTSTYQVSDAVDTAGPVLLVTATGHNQAAVEHTLSGVTSEITTKLEAIQAGLGDNNKIRDAVITFAPQPTTLKSKKEKPLLLLLALGLVATIGIPVIVDAQLSRRTTRDEDARLGGAEGRDEQTVSSHEELVTPRNRASHLVEPRRSARRSSDLRPSRPDAGVELRRGPQHIEEADYGRDSARLAPPGNERRR
jgi:hypothetical protein